MQHINLLRDRYDSLFVLTQLDSRMGIDAWKRATGSSSHLFDEKLIVKITRKLSLNRQAVSDDTISQTRKRELITEMIRILRQGGAKANFGNLDNEYLYAQRYDSLFV
jgi:hypothetical protein